MKKLITIFFILFISVQCHGNEFSYTSVAGGGGGDMLAATYDPGLVATPMAFQSVILTAGVGLSGGGDLSAARTFDLADTAVTPGSYTNTIITVNQQGQLTAASSGIGDLVPASTDSGQFLLGDGIGGWNPEPISDIYFDANNQLVITSTVGPQQEWRYDGSNSGHIQVDSVGNVRIHQTGSSIGVGFEALGPGAQSAGTAMGLLSLSLATGGNSAAYGAYSAYRSFGSVITAMGFSSLSDNNAPYAIGLGPFSGMLNGGPYLISLGYENSKFNGGTETASIGVRANFYNQGDRAVAIGYEANAAFNPDTGGDRLFDFTDIDPLFDRVIVTAHGYGPNGGTVALLYTEGTSQIPGMTTGTIHQWKIITANVIELVNPESIISPGTGTGHKFTPQFINDNQFVLGNNSIPPDRADIIYLGGSHTKTIIDMDLEVTGTVTANGLTELRTSESVADDAFIDLPAGVSGWGTVFAGDNQEHTRFWFSTDGTVTLSDSTANVVNTDTDANLCVFDGGAFVRISNRLGLPLTLKISAEY